MFELRKSFTFEASHVLTKHDGKCSRLHGHSYTLRVVLRGDTLHPDGPKRNMLTDFGDISKAVKGLISSHLDHRHLNDSLSTDSPTAEYIARWVYYQLAPIFPHLAQIEIGETSSSVAIYRPSRGERRAAFEVCHVISECMQEPSSSIANGTHSYPEINHRSHKACNGVQPAHDAGMNCGISSNSATESDGSDSECECGEENLTASVDSPIHSKSSRQFSDTSHSLDDSRQSGAVLR